MFKSKIHRATVTEANLNYMGSITIDEALMEAADILINEKVQIVNNNNGARFETYVIKGPRNSGVICLNGAAARLVQPGDNVIIISYAMLDRTEARTFKPTILMVDEKNQIADNHYCSCNFSSLLLFAYQG
jgi:aspartate 1-decarboxylase